MAKADREKAQRMAARGASIQEIKTATGLSGSSARTVSNNYNPARTSTPQPAPSRPSGGSSGSGSPSGGSSGSGRPSGGSSGSGRPSGGSSGGGGGGRGGGRGGSGGKSSPNKNGARQAAAQQAAIHSAVDQRAQSGGSVGQQWFQGSGLDAGQTQAAMDYAASQGYTLGNSWADQKQPIYNEAGHQVLRTAPERTAEELARRDGLRTEYGPDFAETWVPGLMQPGQNGYNPQTGGGNWVYAQGASDPEALRAWYRGDPNSGTDLALEGKNRADYTLEGLYGGGGSVSGQQPTFDWDGWNSDMQAQQAVIWASMDAMNAQFLQQQEAWQQQQMGQMGVMTSGGDRRGFAGSIGGNPDLAQVKRKKRKKPSTTAAGTQLSIGGGTAAGGVSTGGASAGKTLGIG